MPHLAKHHADEVFKCKQCDNQEQNSVLVIICSWFKNHILTKIEHEKVSSRPIFKFYLMQSMIYRNEGCTPKSIPLLTQEGKSFLTDREPLLAFHILVLTYFVVWDEHD